LGFTISVQSASHPSGEIALCIDRFVHEEFIQILKEMSCITFKHHVDAIKRLKSQKDTNLTEETYRYWEEIQSRTYEFHAIKEIVNSFDECTKEQLIERYIKWMLKDTLIEEEGTRKLRVHVIGKNCKQYLPIEKLVNEDQVPHLIDNLKEYKKTLRCHI
jgi:secreted Zn-dependent insulinase-like peptidase